MGTLLFLLTDKGKPYIPVFKCLLLKNLLGSSKCIKLLEKDSVIPKGKVFYNMILIGHYWKYSWNYSEKSVKVKIKVFKVFFLLKRRYFIQIFSILSGILRSSFRVKKSKIASAACNSKYTVLEMQFCSIKYTVFTRVFEYFEQHFIPIKAVQDNYKCVDVNKTLQKVLKCVYIIYTYSNCIYQL